MRSLLTAWSRRQQRNTAAVGKSYVKAARRTIGAAGKREISLQFDLAQSGIADSPSCWGLSYP
jgi:hypothetical protein